MALTAASKLASGSPMPIMTTLVGAAPSWRAACQTWPMISATLRLRLKPWRAVAQKAHSSAQPTWEDTQMVLRLPSGMNTVSTRCPSTSSSTHLTVPSADGCVWRMRGSRISTVSSRTVRRLLGRSVMASKSTTPCLCIHLKRLRPWNALKPSAVTSDSQPARSRSSGLGLVEVAFMAVLIVSISGCGGRRPRGRRRRSRRRRSRASPSRARRSR